MSHCEIAPGERFRHYGAMLLFCRWLVILLSALALAGCSTVEEQEPAPRPLPPTQAPVPAPQRLPAPVTPAQPRPEGVVTNPPSVVPKTNTVTVTTNAVAPAVPKPIVPNYPPETTQTAPLPSYVHAEQSREWVDMLHWSVTNGPCQMRQNGWSVTPRYTVRSPKGDIDFTINDQIARWNGLSFMLGFAPKMWNNKPYIYGLDLANSIQPLTKGFRWPNSGTRVLVIDPGHGGDDPGSRTVVGDRPEKELTLDWARRIQATFAARDTNHIWKVYLTRTNDVDITRSNRVAIAERLHADLFISLHFNSFANPDQSGVETFCSTPAGMPSNLTRGAEDDLPQPNNAYDAANLYWAMQLHREMIRTAHASDRAVRRARFLTVLKLQKRPAVLIEGGYLSNRKEARQIISESYRQKLADAVVQAVLNP